MSLAYEANSQVVRRYLIQLLSINPYITATARRTIREELRIQTTILIDLCIEKLQNGIEIVTKPAVDPPYTGKMQHRINFKLDNINHEVRIKFQFNDSNPRKPIVSVVSAKKHHEDFWNE